MAGGNGRLPAPFRELVSRAVGLVDRRPFSPNGGCADREFWQYRSTRGFASAPFQAVAMGLAAGGHPVLARQVLRFWTSLAHGDGAFSEWFENERSFCATAHTAGYALETVGLLGMSDADPLGRKVLDTCRGAGRWLGRQRFPMDANQVAAALSLFTGLARTTGETEFHRLAARGAATLGRLRAPEGWFLERGGFDAGYASLTLAHLTRASGHGTWPRIERWRGELERFLVSLSAHLDPSPWEAWSRETAFLLPPCGGAFFDRWLETSHFRWAGWDDRYLAFFALPQMAFLAQYGAPGTVAGPGGGSVVEWREAGGCWVGGGADVRWVVGLAKGGTLRRIFPDGRVGLDLGYVVVDRRGREWTSLARGGRWSRVGPQHYRTTIALKPVDRRLPLVGPGVVLPLLARGLPAVFAHRASVLGRLWGTRDGMGGSLQLERRLAATAAGIEIVDRLCVGRRFSSIRLNRGETPSLGPSARMGPGVGEETWLRSGLDEGQRALLCGSGLRWFARVTPIEG